MQDLMAYVFAFAYCSEGHPFSRAARLCSGNGTLIVLLRFFTSNGNALSYVSRFVLEMGVPVMSCANREKSSTITSELNF